MSILRKRRRDYHGVSPHVEPKRLRKQERGGKIKRFLNRVYLVIIMGTLFWLGYFIFFGSILEIKEIDLTAGKTIKEQEIREVVKDFLNEKRYLIFSQKNFFVLDEKGLEKRLQGEFFLSELAIKKDFPKKLIIDFEEKASSFNLCLGGNCYQVDYLGNVLARVGESDFGELLVNYTNVTNATNETNGGDGEVEEEVVEGMSGGVGENNNLPKVVPGLTMLPEKKVRVLLDLYEIFSQEAFGVEIDFMEIYDFDGLKKKLTVKTVSGFKVFFDEDGDLQEQVDDLNLILAREIGPDLEGIEYIDLRFGNKIFYK